MIVVLALIFSLIPTQPAQAATYAEGWLAFLGGGGLDYGLASVVDASGNVYVAGRSTANWGSPVRGFTASSSEAFAAKFDSDGVLLWSTFLGGPGSDYGNAIAVDAAGNTYVAGFSTAAWSCSPTPCTVSAFTSSGYEAFVAKVDPSGNLVWNTFLGGSGSDFGYGVGIATDAGGNVYLAGRSSAAWGSPVRAYAGGYDAFAAKLDSGGSLLWHTFLGGPGSDNSSAVAVDAGGNAFISGRSGTSWGSPVQAFLGGNDAFAAKLDPDGVLLWNTFLGSYGDDGGNGIAVDAGGDAYVSGFSDSSWGAPAAAFTDLEDAFAAKLNGADGSLLWNTFLGGSGSDFGFGAAISGSAIYLTGNSNAAWGSPARPFAVNDAFVAKLDPADGSLTWNTFLGGPGSDNGYGLATDAVGNAYLAGQSDAAWGSPSRAYSSANDAFIAKVDVAPPAVASITPADPNPTNAASVDFTVTFSEFVTGVDTSDFAVTASGVTGASVSGVSGSGAIYTVTVDTGSGDGSLRLDLNDDDSVLDAIGNPLGGTGSGNGDYTGGGSYTVMKTAPVVTSVLRADPDPTNAPSVDFTVTFSAPVTGVDSTDFAVTASGVTGAAVTGVSGSGSTYTVSVDTGSGDGTIRLDALDDDSITDATGNPLNGGYTGGESYTVDKSTPETQIDSQPADPSNSREASFTFSSPDATAAFECQLDGGGFAPCTSPVNYTGLADSLHSFEVRAVDLAGNTDPTPASYAWNIDATAPDTQIDSFPANPSSSADATFTFSSPDATAAFECQFDGSGFAPCVSPANYTGLADGPHTFEVQAKDILGNTDPTPASYTWTIDTAAPDTQIDSQPANPSTSADATFTFSSPDGGVAFACQLDGGGFAPCVSPANYTGLGDGPHTFEVRSSDAAGNTDPTPASYGWMIDATAPDTQIDSFPANPSTSADASFSFSSPDGGVSFACQLDGGGFAPCASPADYTGLGDGPHTFEVRATDAAGNTDPTPASYAWTIDTLAPDTQIDSQPADPSNSADATFSFSSPDGGVAFACQLDGGGFAPCASPVNYTGLGDGPHTFEARASDAAGNTDPTPASYAWTIDTAAPETQIDSQPADPSNSRDASFTFSSPDATATFECQMDGSGFAPCASPVNYTSLADGLHNFEVRAVDLAGNTDPTPASYAWNIDATAPDTQIDSFPANPSSSADASFTFSSPDATATFECQFDGGGFAPCTSPVNYIGLGDGPHTFEVQAKDILGNTDPTPASYAWTIDTLAPDTQIDSQPANPSTSADASFSFSSPDGGVAFACQLDGGGFAPCASPANYIGLADGPHTFEVRSSDAAGNTDPTPASYAWTIDTLAPDTQIDAFPANPSTSADASFTFSSPDGGTSFACQLDGGGFAPCASPADYPGLGDGPHTFEVRATDAAGNTDPTPASYAWTIDATAPTVASVTLAGTSPTNAASVDFSVTFSEPVSGVDETDFAVAASGVTGAAVTGVSGSDAAYTVSVDTGSGDGTLRLDALDDDTIRDASNNPLNGGFTTGESYTIDKTAPDTQMDSQPADPSNSRDASFSFSSPDGGVSFACQLDGGGFAPCASPKAYTGLADGPHTFEARSTDAAGNVDPSPASYTWSIDATPPNTQIDTKPANPSSSADASFTFSSPDGGVTFACQLDGGGIAPCASPVDYTGLADGLHIFDVRATDALGNTDPTPAIYTWVIDTAAPDTQIDTKPANPSNSANPSFSFSSPDLSAVFECQLDGGGFASCASPKAYTGLADGPHTFEVRAVDLLNNTDPTPASYTWTIDTAAPDTQIDTHPADPSNSADASFTFSSPNGGATFECQLDGGGFASCNSPKDYTGLGNGTHTFQVRSTDAAGNTDPTPASFTWTLDTGLPFVSSILRANGNPTEQASVGFTVAFTKPVTGVDATDFALVTTGTISGATVTGVSGSGAAYTVTVNTGSGDGTLRLDLIDDDSIGDAFGNKLGGAGTGNGDYTTGDSYTVRKPVTVTLRSQGGYDGWILERGQYSNQGGSVDAAAATLILGDSAGNSQYRSILSFNTAGLPNQAIITKVTLKVKRLSIVGTNPFKTHKKLVLDIKKGPFSGANTLMPTDFEAAASLQTAGVFNSTPAAGWYSVTLKTTAFQFVNLTGLTQIRLRFQLDDNNDSAVDNILFYSGNALFANRPIIVIEYYNP